MRQLELFSKITRAEAMACQRRFSGAVSIRDIRLVGWSDEHPTEAAAEWRKDTQVIADRLVQELKKLELLRPLKSTKRRPLDYVSATDLVFRLLRKTPGLAIAEDASEYQDIAYWAGRVLAFGYTHMDTSVRQSSMAARALQETLAQLMSESRLLAWENHPFPDWAQDLHYVLPYNEDTAASEVLPYRSWKEVERTLVLTIQTFREHTQGLLVTPAQNDGMIANSMSLRLLASVVPGRVSDKLVRCLTWLERQVKPSRPAELKMAPLRELLLVAWERSLLERGPQNAKNADESYGGRASLDIPSLPSRRRTM